MISLRQDESDERRIEKLNRIADVLVERIDKLEEGRGSAWSMFQAAVALEQEVQARTRDLEKALADLSERNRELAVARAAAEEANRSKTRFLRAASHDLLQPLSAAKLFLSALKDTALDDFQSELALRLSGAFESVEELMHAVLDIARLDSQRIEFQRKPVELARLFHRLGVEYAPMAEAKGLRLTFAPTSTGSGRVRLVTPSTHSSLTLLWSTFCCCARQYMKPDSATRMTKIVPSPTSAEPVADFRP